MKNMVVMLLLGFAANTALAGVLNERGAYVGLGAGLSQFDDDGQFTFTGGVNDDEDKSFLLYGGYRFFKYFSVEGRLVNLGTYNVTSFNADIEYAAITANAVGIIPFGESGWEVFGQAGLGAISRDTALASGDDSGGVFTLGIGVRFTPIRNLSLALQVDGYSWVEEATFGDDYVMSIGTSQLLVQYNF